MPKGSTKFYETKRDKPNTLTPTISWRDLAREGPGRHFANSPWTQRGIFIQGHPTTATKESFPGMRKERVNAPENVKSLKTIHEFVDGGRGICLQCVMLKEGHDRLMEKLGA